MFTQNVTFEIKLTPRITFRSTRNYSEKIFVEILRSIGFTDNSNHTCVNDVYQDFVSNFLPAVKSVAPIRTLIVKSNTKSCFDIDELTVIQNRDKHNKKFKQSGK